MDNTAVVDQVVDTEQVVASKFKWSDLYKNEDWWAIWLGFIVITLGFISVTTEAFTFKGVKVATWGTAENPSVLSVLADGKFIMGVGFTFIVLALLFSIGMKCMGKSPVKFIAGFAGVFLLALLAYTLAAQVTMKNYLEYAFWALLIGMLVCNTIKTPEWIKPAIQTEFYIKTGLVIMGAEVLFSNIAEFGIYGLGIAWLVTPVVIIFMWLFGTKFLKITNKSMVMIIACATSVCGTSAAIASAAACKGKKNDLTFAVGLSLIFTVVMMVAMPFVCKWMNIDPMIGGAWIGGTVDSTGAVVLAGEALGPIGGQVAALVKMIQNILIGFIAFAVAIFFTTKVDNTAGNKVGVSEIWHRFPKFIIGFVLASVVFSFLVEPAFGTETTKAVIKSLSGFKGWCFCLAFMSIGLETNFKEMASQMQGGKPLTLYVVGQVFNLILTLFVAWLLLSGIFLPIPNIIA
ncbi:putative sulfate exporter family transporter [Niameybacter massiliensis]|uniref:Sulfate exporter family transporter n=1 Tax=Holtiella tumoricola TaxID=3018743 RepID=A0AA42DRR8_9FIRM|nr:MULTISPECIES: putative sulfate exporter family transporter [Lachnospirales]MDA3734123.1 putative sulfate exporter family transporter [Holtiella tumoricola]